MKKDLISIKDLTTQEIEELFDLAVKLKRNKSKFNKVLTGKTLALIFQKPSNIMTVLHMREKKRII